MACKRSFTSTPQVFQSSFQPFKQFQQENYNTQETLPNFSDNQQILNEYQQLNYDLQQQVKFLKQELHSLQQQLKQYQEQDNVNSQLQSDNRAQSSIPNNFDQNQNINNDNNQELLGQIKDLEKQITSQKHLIATQQIQLSMLAGQNQQESEEEKQQKSYQRLSIDYLNNLSNSVFMQVQEQQISEKEQQYIKKIQRLEQQYREQSHELFRYKQQIERNQKSEPIQNQSEKQNQIPQQQQNNESLQFLSINEQSPTYRQSLVQVQDYLSSLTDFAVIETEKIDPQKKGKKRPLTQTEKLQQAHQKTTNLELENIRMKKEILQLQEQIKNQNLQETIKKPIVQQEQQQQQNQIQLVNNKNEQQVSQLEQFIQNKLQSFQNKTEKNNTPNKKKYQQQYEQQYLQQSDIQHLQPTQTINIQQNPQNIQFQQQQQNVQIRSPSPLSFSPQVYQQNDYVNQSPYQQYQHQSPQPLYSAPLPYLQNQPQQLFPQHNYNQHPSGFYNQQQSPQQAIITPMSQQYSNQQQIQNSQYQTQQNQQNDSLEDKLNLAEYQVKDLEIKNEMLLSMLQKERQMRNSNLKKK